MDSGLHVVDDGGRAVEADSRREKGRLDAGIAALALQALEQGRLLAADVGPGTGVDHDVDREVAAEDVAADGAVGVGLVEGGLEPLDGQGELAPDVEEDLVGAWMA